MILTIPPRKGRASSFTNSTIISLLLLLLATSLIQETSASQSANLTVAWVIPISNISLLGLPDPSQPVIRRVGLILRNFQEVWIEAVPGQPVVSIRADPSSILMVMLEESHLDRYVYNLGPDADSYSFDHLGFLWLEVPFRVRPHVAYKDPQLRSNPPQDQVQREATVSKPIQNETKSSMPSHAVIKKDVHSDPTTMATGLRRVSTSRRLMAVDDSKMQSNSLSIITKEAVDVEKEKPRQQHTKRRHQSKKVRQGSTPVSFRKTGGLFSIFASGFNEEEEEEGSDMDLQTIPKEQDMEDRDHDYQSRRGVLGQVMDRTFIGTSFDGSVKVTSPGQKSWSTIANQFKDVVEEEEEDEMDHRPHSMVESEIYTQVPYVMFTGSVVNWTSYQQRYDAGSTYDVTNDGSLVEHQQQRLVAGTTGVLDEEMEAKQDQLTDSDKQSSSTIISQFDDSRQQADLEMDEQDMEVMDEFIQGFSKFVINVFDGLGKLFGPIGGGGSSHVSSDRSTNRQVAVTRDDSEEKIDQTIIDTQPLYFGKVNSLAKKPSATRKGGRTSPVVTRLTAKKNREQTFTSTDDDMVITQQLLIPYTMMSELNTSHGGNETTGMLTDQEAINRRPPIPKKGGSRSASSNARVIQQIIDVDEDEDEYYSKMAEKQSMNY